MAFLYEWKTPLKILINDRNKHPYPKLTVIWDTLSAASRIFARPCQFVICLNNLIKSCKISSTEPFIVLDVMLAMK